ncbi:GPI-anchored protein llg1 [Sarracenia purpurea var. burkii]
MEPINRSWLTPNSGNLFLFLFLLLGGLSVSSSTFISDGVFGDRASISRNLLQAKTPCSVNFEFMNYTVITSQCKGPQYLPSLCCAAFKEFACPYADQLNDLTNDCATTMFSYINLYGKYPPGLFASECRDDKQGLSCPATPPVQSADSKSGSQMIRYQAPLLVLTTGFLLLLLRIF